MRCEEARKRFFETVRGERLDPESSLHLEKCEGCSKAFEEYKGLFNLLETEQEPSLEKVRSPQYLVSLRERIEASERGWLFGYPKPGFVVTLASAVVLALLLLNLSNFSDRFPYVASYTSPAVMQYVERPSSMYLGAEEELVYLLSATDMEEQGFLPKLLSINEAEDLLQAGELLSTELSLEILLEDLSGEEMEALSQRIQNLISALRSKTEEVKKC